MTIFKSNKEEIKELRDKIEVLERRQYEFLEHAHKIIQNISEQSKKSYVWHLREEETELMHEGKKMKAIRKIVE